MFKQEPLSVQVIATTSQPLMGVSPVFVFQSLAIPHPDVPRPHVARGSRLQHLHDGGHVTGVRRGPQSDELARQLPSRRLLHAPEGLGEKADPCALTVQK